MLKLKIKKISTTINVTDIFLLFLIMVFFEPAYLSYNFSKLNVIFTLLKNLIFMICFINEIVILCCNQKQRCSRFVYIVFFTHLMLVISTILNNGEIMSSISRLINATSIAYITEFGLKTRKEKFIKLVTSVLIVFIIINLFTMVLYPNGLYKYIFLDGTYNSEYWFLGQKNSIGKVCMIAVTLQLICNQISGRFWNLRVIALIIISFISILLAKSTGSLITFTLLIIFLFFLSIAYNLHMKKISLIFRMKNYCIIVILVFLFISIFQLTINNDNLVYFITKVLNKDITFTGRTIVWTNAILRILKSPLYGYGIRDVAAHIYLLKGTIHTSDCHNYYINVFFQGGLIHGIPYMYLFYLMIKKLDKYRIKKITMILSSTLFCFFILFITECFYYTPLWVLFTLIYHLEKILNYEKNCKNC